MSFDWSTSNSMSFKDATKKSFSMNYHSMSFIFDDFASYDPVVVGGKLVLQKTVNET